MKKLLESWRQYKLLLEQEDEQKNIPDKELRKQVSPVDEDYYPIQKWADENGFTLRQIDSNALKSYLGTGAYGKAFAAVKNGKEYAVKIGSPGREQEMNVIDKLIELRKQMPEDISRHIIHFYSPEELGFKDTVYDDKGLYYFVSVAELLQPLTSGDRKKLESSKWRNRFDNIEVEKNSFWSNREWGDVENILNDKLENTNKIKKLFIDALYEVRSLITKQDKAAMVKYQNDFSSRSNSGNEEVLKALGKEPVSWDNIWTEMIMDRLFKGEKGKRLLNHYIKNIGLEPQEALVNIWQMVDNAGKIIFFSNIPVDYSVDKDTDPDNAPPGELKSLHNAMKKLRDVYNIIPTDLHSGNIMRRGHDWVMMDVGLFEIMD